MSTELIRNLRSFNRKERFYLIAAATEGGFKLSEEFRYKLNDAVEEICIKDRSNAYVAMDYRLDWIYASLHQCSFKDSKGEKFQREYYEKDGKKFITRLAVHRKIWI